jgi:hypothetical protein
MKKPRIPIEYDSFRRKPEAPLRTKNVEPVPDMATFSEREIRAGLRYWAKKFGVDEEQMQVMTVEEQGKIISVHYKVKGAK